jgi:serine phosphatase RsbU (regulator of sigma subunit)
MSPVRTGLLARAGRGLSRMTTLALLMPVRKRLLALALLGLTLTLSVAAAALVALAQVGDMNTRLTELNLAQRYHQDADMMHDALHADVARAQQVGESGVRLRPAEVRADTAEHARLFRADLVKQQSLRLPAALEAALDRVEPRQAAYIGAAEELVDDFLAGDADAAALAAFEREFDALRSALAEVTDSLTQAAAQTRTSATAEKGAALRNVGAASAIAMCGWLALVLWHHRSMDTLDGALLREAEHRSVADLLQRSLLPRRLPAQPGITIAARALPGQRGNRVGGDWYDVIPLGGGKLGLVVGDVLGHDLPAATAMGQLRNALRAYAVDDPSPSGVLARVNRAVDLLEVVELATCIYAVLDPATLSVRWSSAGHLAPLVSSADGTGRLLHADPGPPFGVLSEAVYADHELQLAPGEALALYSDGLVERRGRSIDHGLSALVAVQGPYADANTMCDRLMGSLLNDQTHSDDVTLLVVQTEPVAADARPEPRTGRRSNRVA